MELIFAEKSFPIMKGVNTMKIVKGFLSGLVLFILGLEIGGFGMWCITISALKSANSEPTYRQRKSY